jgi:putative PIN family toxin of toxin-antitoxin system
LLDTNVLISAALFAEGVPAQGYDLALTTNADVVICDFTIAELKDVFTRKFPDRAETFERFIAGIESGIRIVPAPAAPPADVDQTKVRDPKDWPILRAALASHCDAIVTGDKDLIGADLPRPQMLTPAQFLARLKT